MIDIKEAIGEPAAYEMLAEESVELAKAALKLARIERGENPTPVSSTEALKSLNEEFADVINAARILNLSADEETIRYKYNRAEERLAKKGD